MESITFVVSDESVNSYGFRVLTEGIDVSYFQKNPVMFYMHNRENGIVGKWDNIRKEKKQLLADAVFDDSTELSKQIKKQVENGFLRSASIGIDNVEKENINGFETVVKCRLIEISIVDIPSNSNAVKLFKPNGVFCYSLADFSKNEDVFKNTLKDLLNLDNNATEEDIVNAIKKLQDNAEKVIDELINKGCISPDQKRAFMLLAEKDEKYFANFVKQQKEIQANEIEKILNEAERKNLFLHRDRLIFIEIAKATNPVILKNLISVLNAPVCLTELIKTNDKKANWTLTEYRKYAPEELRKDPLLYSRLLAEEKESNQERDLDWYRKNNPKALEENNELFQQLIKK